MQGGGINARNGKQRERNESIRAMEKMDKANYNENPLELVTGEEINLLYTIQARTAQTHFDNPSVRV